MKLIRLMAALVLVLALGSFSPALARTQGSQGSQGSQGWMTTADVQRLEDALTDAQHDLAQAQSRDLLAQLNQSLSEARDDTTYLKVKMRKGDSVPRSQYFELRDRIDDIRARARATATTESTSSFPAGDVPVGTEFDVRLAQTLSSDTAHVEDRVEATTMVDLKEGDRVIVPAGSTVRGVVSSVNKAGRVDRKGSLTLAFDRITIDGQDYPMKATVTQALESEGVKGEIGKIGAGAGVGAIIGGILGGFKGALAGILIGGGGTIAATDGKDVELAAGTVLRLRLDTALDLL